MNKKPEVPTGRVVIDDRGRSIWQTPLDAAELTALTGQLHLEGQEPPESLAREKRRTLDDMRKLSEQIKSSKVWYRVPKRRRGGTPS